MEWIRDITGCPCCSDTYGVEGKHWYLYLTLSNIRNAMFGFEISIDKLGKGDKWATQLPMAFHVELHCWFFGLKYKRKFLSTCRSDGNLDVEHWQESGLSAIAYVNFAPLNGDKDCGCYGGFPMLPSFMYHRMWALTDEQRRKVMEAM